jgi:hypothetical protein
LRLQEVEIWPKKKGKMPRPNHLRSISTSSSTGLPALSFHPSQPSLLPSASHAQTIPQATAVGDMQQQLSNDGSDMLLYSPSAVMTSQLLGTPHLTKVRVLMFEGKFTTYFVIKLDSWCALAKLLNKFSGIL